RDGAGRGRDCADVEGRRTRPGSGRAARSPPPRCRGGGRRARGGSGTRTGRRRHGVRDRPAQPTRRHDGDAMKGLHHVGITVKDLDASIRFYNDVNVVDEGVLAGWRWVYFEDPDGYPLELVEVAYYNGEERRAGIAAYLASRS